MLIQCNPPIVLGPVAGWVSSLDAVNTSNLLVRDIMSGKYKNGLPPTRVWLWVDVRDVALAHVLAAEMPEAANKRFFIVAGRFSNKEIAEIVGDNFPDLAGNVPTGDALKPGDYPEQGTAKWNNSRAVNVLGLRFRSLKESVVDTVKSLQEAEK
jgi:nucleoside-diphosphate-sugar epimerase